jgi:hypothetical protein
MTGGRPDTHRAVSLLSVASVAVAAPLLARMDLPRLQSCLEPPQRSAQSPAADPGHVVEVFGRRVDQVIRWGKPLVRPGCLTRGITGYYSLRRVGLDVALCFGVASVRSASMTGHCWLVLNEEPVLETMDPRLLFIELVRLSSCGLTNTSVAQ